MNTESHVASNPSSLGTRPPWWRVGGALPLSTSTPPPSLPLLRWRGAYALRAAHRYRFPPSQN